MVHGGVFMNFELDGKVALVSGCSQGIGYVCAKILAAHGADIFGVSIGDDTALKKEIEEMGRQYHSLTISLSTANAIHTLMKETLAAYGKIDILVNFAATLKRDKTLHITKHEWSDAFHINVASVFFLSQEVIKQFQKQATGGKIINASGILPFDTNEYITYYTCKGAIEAMTRYLALEFAKDHIQVNSIAFGYMDIGSKLQQTNGNENDISILQRIPAGHWGTKQDIHGALLLFASSYSDYITGACLALDGGYAIH